MAKANGSLSPKRAAERMQQHRHAQSGPLRNEITCNPWVWGAVLLCALLLATPPYLPPLAKVMHLTPPSPAMWVIIVGLSVAPLIVIQTVTLSWRRHDRG